MKSITDVFIKHPGGVCDSCALRLKGFREEGIPDPIPYS